MRTNPIYAFFDVDDTIINTKSMFAFFSYWCEQWICNDDLLNMFNSHFSSAQAEGAPREQLNRDYYRFLAETNPSTLAMAGEAWANGILGDDLFHSSTVTQLKDLARKDITPVFVSGSFHEILRPISQYLGVPHILATRMILGSNGLYTGEIADPQTIGAGKAVAIRQFLKSRGGMASECWAFGDDVSDIPMLECVGHPVAIGSNAELSKTARGRGWPILDLA